MIKHPEVETVCTRLALSLLSSLEHIVDGHTFREEQVTDVNRAFSLLWDTSPPSQQIIEKNVESMSKNPSKSRNELNGHIQSTETEPPMTIDLGVENPIHDEEIASESEPSETPTPGPDPPTKFEFPPPHAVICKPRTDIDERQSAHRFTDSLLLKIRSLVKKISTLDADEDMQQFASTFCEGELVFYTYSA